jgi:sugar O-acyltransferase (sialic acid O-acetyltransferase NeuD family)
MTAIALFAIGSPIVVEYEETCGRLGVAIVTGIRNRSGPTFVARSVPIVDAADLRPAHRATPCVVPLFTPGNRVVAVGEAAALGLVFADALIDPTAIVASSARAGRGAFVNAGCILGAHAALGEHVLVNRGTSIGHHAAIDAFVSLGPGVVVAGNVAIGEGALIGAGAIVLPKVRIGAGAVIGAGSVVVHDVPPGAKVLPS